MSSGFGDTTQLTGADALGKRPELLLDLAMAWEEGGAPEGLRWDDAAATEGLLELMTEPKKRKVQGGEAYYFGQLNEKGEMHGRGVLFMPKTKYLYYGFFAGDQRHGFGREFYDEKSALDNAGTQGR